MNDTKVYTVFENDTKNPSVPATAVFESTRSSIPARRYASSMNMRAKARAGDQDPRFYYSVSLWDPKKSF